MALLPATHMQMVVPEEVGLRTVSPFITRPTFTAVWSRKGLTIPAQGTRIWQSVLPLTFMVAS